MCDDLSGRLINFVVGPLFQLRVVHPMWCCIWKICHLIFQMPIPRSPSWDYVSSLFFNFWFKLKSLLINFVNFAMFFLFLFLSDPMWVEGTQLNALLPTQLFNYYGHCNLFEAINFFFLMFFLLLFRDST